MFTSLVLCIADACCVRETGIANFLFFICVICFICVCGETGFVNCYHYVCVHM